MFLYAITLARRIPNHKLAGQTRIVMWGVVICTALMIVGAIASLLMGLDLLASGGAGYPSGSGATDPPFAFLAVSMGTCSVSIGTFVFCIWAIVLIFMYRSAFLPAAKYARSSWVQDVMYRD